MKNNTEIGKSYKSTTKQITLLGGILVGLLGAGFGLSNHDIYLPGLSLTCASSMLPMALYLLLISWMGYMFGHRIQQQMWVMSGIVMVVFTMLGTAILLVFPASPSNMVTHALWEQRFPMAFLCYWGAGGLQLPLLKFIKNRWALPIPIATRWLEPLLSGGIGSLLNGVARCCDGKPQNIKGDGLGFFLCASVGSLLGQAMRGTIYHGKGSPQKVSAAPYRVTLYQLLAMTFAGACVMANLMVVKHLALFGGVVTAGLFIYIITFMLTDVISEVYDEWHAQTVVLAGFVSNVVLMGVVCLIMPCKSADITTVTTLSKTFGFFFAIVIASIIAYLISQWLDIYLFALIRSQTGGRWLWLRNNTATIISQTADTVLFAGLAWAIWSWFPGGKGDLSWEVWQSIAWQEWGWKLVLALLDTPLVYLLVKKLKPNANQPLSLQWKGMDIAP